jgi:hypothetical protein
VLTIIGVESRTPHLKGKQGASGFPELQKRMFEKKAITAYHIHFESKLKPPTI